MWETIEFRGGVVVVDSRGQHNLSLVKLYSRWCPVAVKPWPCNPLLWYHTALVEDSTTLLDENGSFTNREWFIHLSITVIYARLIWSHACQEIGSVRLAKCTYRGRNPLSSGNQTHRHYPHSLIAIVQIKVKTGFGHKAVFVETQCILPIWYPHILQVITTQCHHYPLTATVLSVHVSVSGLSTNSYSIICTGQGGWFVLRVLYLHVLTKTCKNKSVWSNPI